MSFLRTIFTPIPYERTYRLNMPVEEWTQFVPKFLEPPGIVDDSAISLSLFNFSDRTYTGSINDQFFKAECKPDNPLFTFFSGTLIQGHTEFFLQESRIKISSRLLAKEEDYCLYFTLSLIGTAALDIFYRGLEANIILWLFLIGTIQLFFRMKVRSGHQLFISALENELKQIGKNITAVSN